MPIPAIISALLPSVIGPLIGGIFGSKAAAPAATGAESSAQAQADMINMLMEQYKNVLGPAQANIMGQYQGLAGAAPTQDMFTFQTIMDLLPQFMPDILRARGEQRVTEQGQRELLGQQRRMEQGGMDLTSPAAQAMLQRTRESTLRGLHGTGAEAMTWEANQTLARRDMALNRALEMLGLAGQYSQVGSAMPGTAIQGASNLTGQLSQAAQGAALPWQQMGANVGQALQTYYSTPQQPMIPSPEPSYMPWVPYPTNYAGATGSNLGMY